MKQELDIFERMKLHSVGGGNTKERISHNLKLAISDKFTAEQLSVIILAALEAHDMETRLLSLMSSK